MKEKKSESDQEQFTKKSLDTYETDYKNLFIEITKCGIRNGEEKNGQNVPILKHPTFPAFSRLDFTHLFRFLIGQIEQKGLTSQDLHKEVDTTSIQWDAFYRGQYRNVSSNIVEVGICTAARLAKTPLILLLAQFLEECEATKIRLFSHEAFEETISSFLLEAKRIASQQTSNAAQHQNQEPDQSFVEQTEIIDGLELVHGKEKWLDPYNLSEILFIARDAELEKLDLFASHKDEFKIWAIEGPSGAGKTRLTIEWVNRSKAVTLKGWDLRILRKQDRNNPTYWSTWLPKKQTLIIIDYMFGFDQIIANLIYNCSKSPVHKVRLLLLDHVFSTPLHCDTRWGFSVDRSSLNRNERHFYDLKPLDLNETQDQETVIRGIISQRTKIDDQSDAVNKVVDYLRKTQSAWRPLFAALVGDALKSGQDVTQWNRRELIDYYLADKRLPWKLDNELIGRWAGYFISVATIRRGVAYRDMIDAAGACKSSPTHFGPVKETCRHIVADNHPTILAPFEPDILGESFFLLFLKELEDSIVCQTEFRQIFLAGDPETQVRDAIEFIGFIERLTRNLLNDDQNQVETQEFWQTLFNFLRPSDFPKHNILRWAVCAALVNLIGKIKDILPKETVSTLLNQVEPTDLYEVEDARLLHTSTVCSMQLFELINCLAETEATISDDMLKLLERNYQNDDGDNEYHPLMIAISHDFIHTATFLIDQGEDVDTKMLTGQNTLIVASLLGQIEIVDLLLDRGAEIHVSNKKRRTALMWASLNGHTETVKLLLKLGAKINASDNDGSIALIWASGDGQTEAIECLLKSGAEIDASNNEGRTALMSASLIGHTETVDLLLDRGAKINATDDQGRTALMWASVAGHTETVERLLIQGANIESADSKGKTALMFASKKGYADIAKLLSTDTSLRVDD